MKKPLTEQALAKLILNVLKTLETPETVYVSLADPAFNQVPCSPTRLYQVAARRCQDWGYTYQPISHHVSRPHHRCLVAMPVSDQKKPALIKSDKIKESL